MNLFWGASQEVTDTGVDVFAQDKAGIENERVSDLE